jgi:putative FmdB family regulatory protein
MPIYEFRCDRCESRFEEILSIHARGARPCPACGRRARRVMSRSSFQLRGTGWYATDYKTPAAPRAGDGSGERP